MDAKHFVSLAFEIETELKKVNGTIHALQQRVKELADYAEQVRLAQRNQVEVWLEETFPQLFTAKKSQMGQEPGYQHYVIMNDFVSTSAAVGFEAEHHNKPLDETKAAFKETMNKFLDEHDGKKILVRIPPQYMMTEEGNHRIRCRIHVEQVNA